MMHDFLKRIVLFVFWELDRTLQEVEYDPPVLDVLSKRRDAEFVVFVEKFRKFFVVCLVVGDFACLSDDAGALFLEFRLANEEFAVQRGFHLGSSWRRWEFIEQLIGILEQDAVLRGLLPHVASNSVELR